MPTQKNALSLRSWSVWTLVSLFYAYQYILRVLPNIMMDDIMVRFSIEANIFGQFSGTYYIGYALAHIPLGMFIDRIGPKKALPICIVLTISGLLPLLFSHNWIYAVGGRFFIGVGSSAAILGVFSVIRLLFPPEKFTRILGVSVTIGLIGAIYGGDPVRVLIATYGTQTILYSLIAIGLALASCIFILTPTGHTSKAPSSLLHQMRTVFFNPYVILLCVCGGFMVGPLEGFADVWGSNFLKIAYGFDATKAATLPSLIFVGMCFGSPLLSYAADHTKAYYATILISAFLMIICFTLLLTQSLSAHTMGIAFVICGICCAYQIPLIYKATTFTPSNATGLTTAAANMIIMIFGYLFHGSIGGLMDIFWTGEKAQGVPLYSALTQIKALSVIPAGLFIGAVGVAWIARVRAKKTFPER